MHNATDKTPTPNDDFTHPRPDELTDEQWTQTRRDTIAFIDQRVTEIPAVTVATCPRSTTWCAEHLGDTGQCTSEAIQAGEAHCYVWLVLELGQSEPTVTVDVPPSGADLTLDQADALRDALAQLREAAQTGRAVQ